MVLKLRFRKRRLETNRHFDRCSLMWNTSKTKLNWMFFFVYGFDTMALIAIMVKTNKIHIFILNKINFVGCSISFDHHFSATLVISLSKMFIVSVFRPFFSKRTITPKISLNYITRYFVKKWPGKRKSWINKHTFER